MRMKLIPWTLTLITLMLLLGCDGGDDNNPTDPLTVANLQGTYDLNVSGSMLSDTIDDEVEVLFGTLEVGTTSATFSLTTSSTRSFEIADMNTITVTDEDGDMTDAQVTLTNNGATLTLLSSGDTLVLERRGGASGSDELTLTNLQGTYDLDIASSSPLDIGDVDFVVTSASLDVMDNTVTFTATGVNMVTYVILGEVTVTITEDDGDMVDLRATLSNNTAQLRLVEADGDRFIFDRR